MSLARSLVLSALALAALAGCPTGEVCTDIAVASVTVRLQDAAGVDLSKRSVHVHHVESPLRQPWRRGSEFGDGGAAVVVVVDAGDHRVEGQALPKPHE